MELWKHETEHNRIVRVYRIDTAAPETPLEWFSLVGNDDSGRVLNAARLLQWLLNSDEGRAVMNRTLPPDAAKGDE